jgi:hypothetical protein
MGLPVWLMLPTVGLDWRWPASGSRTGWYATARLWRVPSARRWEALAMEMARALRSTSGERATTHARNAARGASLLREGQWEAAFEVLSDAAQHASGDAALHANLAIAAMRTRRFDTALDAARHATATAPRLPDAWARMSEALILAGRETEAVAAAERAVALAPDDMIMQLAYARALERADALDDAQRAYDALQRASPHHAQVRYHRSLVLLKRGEWREGWREYEARWDTPAYTTWRAQWPARPRWDGTLTRHLHLHVRHEQGVGDTIMAARWWPLLAARGVRVTAEVPRPLVPLLAGQWPEVTVVPAGTPVAAEAFIPALSVPAALGLDAAPDPTPYLRAPAATPAVRAALSAARAMAGPRVTPMHGLVWAGDVAHPFDHLRSRPLEYFAPLRRALPGAWVSLQVGPRRADLAHAPDLWDAGATCPSFAETATWLTALDTLVAVDTSTAHLAGALGQPVLVVLPRCADWRWGATGRTTPWYGSMRLQRPSPGVEPVVASGLHLGTPLAASPAAFAGEPAVLTTS